MDINYLKSSGVNIDNSLDLLGDIETYNEILNDFYDEISEKLKTLGIYKENGDMENYCILVHSLKSDCKYLGFDKLSDICYIHQVKSEENNLKYIDDEFNNLINEFNKIVSIVKKYLDSI